MRRVAQPVEVTVRHVLRGPHPLGVAEVAATDLAYGRGMAGGTGTVLIGEKHSRKYSGELGPLQNFRGARIVGAALNQRGSLAAQSALPSTHTPASVPNPVMALLFQTQGVMGS